jgi:multisubunit Na+/H+ antiporter MnhB subunit
MGFTQTVVATLAVVLLIIVTLSLNESAFKETDLTKPVGDLCNIVGDELKLASGVDTREMLYGSLSVRGANIAALVLGTLAFATAAMSKNLDLGMESKYQEGSYMLYGNPRAFISGILFRLCAAGAALAMTLSSLLVLSPLTTELSALGGVNRSMTPAADCTDLGPNQIERADLLSAVLVLSAASVFAVGFMVHAIKYDAKASA